jgi:hypothetical protein
MEIFNLFITSLFAIGIVYKFSDDLGKYIAQRQKKQDLYTQLQQRNFLHNLELSLKRDVPTVWK